MSSHPSPRTDALRIAVVRDGSPHSNACTAQLFSSGFDLTALGRDDEHGDLDSCLAVFFISETPDFEDVVQPLRQLLRRAPRTPVLLLCASNQHHGFVRVSEAIGMPARALVVLPEQSLVLPAIVRRRILGARAESLASRLNLYASPTDDFTARLLRFCLVDAPYSPTVYELACATGLSYRTMIRRLQEQRLPNPKHCLQLGQLLLLTDVYYPCRLSVEEYSRWIGFADERPLQAAAVSLIGGLASDSRTPANATELVSLFRAAAQRLHAAAVLATSPADPSTPICT
jgi:hypothetical protein